MWRKRLTIARMRDGRRLSAPLSSTSASSIPTHLYQKGILNRSQNHSRAVQYMGREMVIKVKMV